MSSGVPQTVPRVSVVVPTYNSALVLRLTLASVLAQDLPDFDVWVVGDGCTDDSAAVVAECGDSRVHWRNLPVNTGTQSAPNNLAAAESQADLLAYVNHDDLWLPWHLSGLVALLDASGAEVAHSYYARVGPQGVVNVIGPPPPGSAYGRHHVSPTVWLVRRSLLERVGGWPDPAELDCGVDYGTLQRFVAAGASVACLRRVSVLKFPSHLHRLYDPCGEPAQAAWWERIQTDPVAAERDVLTDLAVAWAGQRQTTPRLRAAVRQWLVDCGARLARWYGVDRPPLPAWRRRQWQRRWRRNRAPRGLPPVA